MLIKLRTQRCFCPLFDQRGEDTALPVSSLPKRGKGNKARAADEMQIPAERRASLSWAQCVKRAFDNETCRDWRLKLGGGRCRQGSQVLQYFFGPGDVGLQFDVVRVQGFGFAPDVQGLVDIALAV